MTPAQIKKICGIKGKPSQERLEAAFDGLPKTNEHGRDAVLAGWAGWW